MEELTRAERIMEAFVSSGKLQELGIIALKMAIILVIGLIILKIILKITRHTLEKSSLDPVLYTFVINAIKVIGTIILITMCLGLLGVQMSTIIAVIGAAGAAIALALRDSLANIAGGVMIIITKPFNRDDFIDVGTVSGKVQDIDLFLTTLKTYDNKTITVPNGLINTSILVNHSREGIRRVDCKFNISYRSDVQKVKEMLQKICSSSPLILDEPQPVIGVSGHEESSIVIDVFAWCDTENYWTVKYFLEEQVKKVFDEEGIEIPYPQVDVHIAGNVQDNK